MRGQDYYKVTDLGDGRYRIYDPLGVHMDLFTGTEKALLFDTGFGLADLKSTVRSITDLPLCILNSHGHMDHVCGNYQFDEPIYIHPDDIDLCKLHHTAGQKEIILNYAEKATDFFTGEPVNALDEDFDRDWYLSRSTGNLIPLEEGHVFDLGGIRLEVIGLAGHTRGSLGLMDTEKRVLYSADAMNNNVWLFQPESTSLSVYRKTLDKAWNMDFDQMIISHFPLTLNKEVLKDYMDIADNLDYSKGLPFSAPLAPGADAKLCIREGYAEDEMFEPGFASIVIHSDKLY